VNHPAHLQDRDCEGLSGQVLRDFSLPKKAFWPLQAPFTKNWFFQTTFAKWPCSISCLQSRGPTKPSSLEFPERIRHLSWFRGVSHAFQLKRPGCIGSNRFVSCPHVVHLKVRCPRSDLSWVLRVTTMLRSHIGQESRAIEIFV
jgi:hypothetical protein